MAYADLMPFSYLVWMQKVTISKYGEDLVIHIPAELVRDLDLAEGDEVHLAVRPDGVMELTRPSFDNVRFFRELRAFVSSSKRSDPIERSLPDGDRY